MKFVHPWLPDLIMKLQLPELFLIYHVKAYIIFFLLPILFVGCKSIEDFEETAKYIIDLSDKNNVQPDSSLFESVEYIPLELTPQSVIGEIHKILSVKNNFYILDRQFAKAIVVFDSKGKFKFAIRSNGNGPGEYLYVYDFDIDSKGNIYVLDLGLKKVIKYNDKGYFQQEFNLDFNPLEFAFLDSTNFAFYRITEHGKILHNLSILNKKNNKTENYFPYRKYFDDRKIPLNSKFHLYRSNDRINFSLYFSNIIFSIKNVKLTPYIKIQSLFEPSSELYAVKQKLNSEKNFSSSDIKLIKDIYENNRLIIFSAENNNSIVYSKATNKVIENKFKDKRYLGSTSFVGVYGDRFISYIDPTIASYFPNWEQSVIACQTNKETKKGLLDIPLIGITYLILVKFKNI